jgi:calcineurin-like phosphoesterase family protein
MADWWMSDPHFFHKNIIELSKRPFVNLDHMHETLIKNINECVRPEDTLYMLGDMNFGSFKEFEPVAKRLNGNKILIKGNHDHLKDGQYAKLGFKVYLELKMKFAGQVIRMTHYPYALPWYKRLFAYKSELRYLDRRAHRVPGEFLIHGHTHSKKKIIDNMIHVGVDAWNFYPVSSGEIESLMNKALKAQR